MDHRSLIISDPQLILRIVSELTSPVDAQNFAFTCRSYLQVLRPTLESLRDWYCSPMLISNMYELLFACNMLQHVSPVRFNIPVAVPPRRGHIEHLRLFWMKHLRLYFLMKRSAILDWSRKVTPYGYARIASLTHEEVNKILSLILGLTPTTSREHNFANLLTADSAIPVLLSNDLKKDIDKAYKLQQLCHLNELAVQSQTMSQVQKCLDDGRPLKIEMCEEEAGKGTVHSVMPIITEIPQLDRQTGRFLLKLRFPNEPKTSNMIFEWRPERAMFRARRRCTLRSSPYEKNYKEYSMRLRPTHYSFQQSN